MRRDGEAPMTFRPPNFKKLPDFTADLPAFAEAYVTRLRMFYDSRASWHRRLYRISGILVILSGAILPVLATAHYPHKEIVVSSIGVLVAALTGLRAFYRWDQSWVVLRQTEFLIDDAYWAWKGNTPNPDAKTASELLQALIKIRQSEAETFFKDLTFPSQHQ